MKNIKLSGLLCGAGWADCTQPASRRDATGAGDQPSSQRRAGGPLDALSPRRTPPDFKKGLDVWKGKAAREQHRAAAGELIERAQLEGKGELVLSSLRLTSVPPQIGALKKLQVLDLSDNNLSDLPASIGDLESLTHLFLDANHLERLPDELENLGQLKHLSAPGNRLSQVPESLHKLQRLQRVDLKSNQLWTLPPKWAELLTRLRRLDLSDNQLTQMPTLPDQNLAGARADVRGRTLELNLSNNAISNLPISYGSFRYHNRFNDHTLINLAQTIIVRTENTRIRESLVAVGRLSPGRGVSAHDAKMFARQTSRAARGKQPSDQDGASCDSFDGYVRRHGEQGQAARFGRRPEMPPESPRSELGERPEWTKPAAARGLDGVAGLFAALGARPAPNAAPDIMAVLAKELQNLPQAQQAAVIGQLAAVPPEVLEAELARMQAVWHGGTAEPSGAPPNVPPASTFAPQAPFAFGTQPTQPLAPQFGMAPPSSVPPVPSFAMPMANRFTAQPVPQPFFMEPELPRGGAQASAERTDAWHTVNEIAANNAPPPWAAARAQQSGAHQEGVDRWAKPTWTTRSTQEEVRTSTETNAYAEPPVFDAHGWSRQSNATPSAQSGYDAMPQYRMPAADEAPPAYQTASDHQFHAAYRTEAEDFDAISMLERMMRMINGDSVD
ncbi:hypothetical protein WKR88_15465 [Trinickia caryophylli]|uniref:Leucine rich repeat-containing protein n=1 Tax=Trinickia caryophylli TaxID=28094 RepID=A0A1X7D4G8_TRICW|nr:leucine-rich repeat domain-containing protein [Trinickia caryophylli]PMS12737.1 hypothetical protein C0Z17_07865 [Trinickia caryophylli]TRX15143.1 hypothetical protein FNF07_28530 [Trinickia caryophylli]WQE15007.1 leucine-rich repeat domain-containing protein [Trinickia caryophylli]SMF08780.1 Leucine rich repeat-containing protein [Trinickia caryophylli]GLU31262.1 hypothetical protein Busp01_11040 [Trinickia caryophylli]